jgi:hypothetical protein
MGRVRGIHVGLLEFDGRVRRTLVADPGRSILRRFLPPIGV